MDNKITHLTPAEIEQYCQDHIGKYNIEPIIKEAYYHNLLSAEKTYIHLRLAEQKEQKEKGIKPYITQKMIATELYTNQNQISAFSTNEIAGITDNIFIKLGIIRNWDKMLNIFEADNCNVQLANFINSYTEQRIADKALSKRTAYLLQNEALSPDNCRKILKELLDERISYKPYLTADDLNEDDIIFTLSSLSFNKGKYTYSLSITYYDNDNVTKEDFSCLKSELVHNIVENIQRRIGGYQRLETTNQNSADSSKKYSSESKSNQRDFYLSTDSDHQKIQRAFQYLAFDKTNIHINI